MSIEVTVLDKETGETESVVVPDGDYLLLVTDPCYLHHTQVHANGTHVLTIKGHRCQS